MTGLNEFEKYLIKRIDDLEEKLTRKQDALSEKFAEVDSKITWAYAFAAGISFVVGIIISLLRDKIGG
jgi:hypothetical protein